MPKLQLIHNIICYVHSHCMYTKSYKTNNIMATCNHWEILLIIKAIYSPKHLSNIFVTFCHIISVQIKKIIVVI